MTAAESPDAGPAAARAAAGDLNAGYDYRERLGADADGANVLVYLSRCYRHADAAEWEARIAAGGVLVDGRPVRADAVLRRGAELVWRRPPWREPAAPRAFTVLYEDADLLAVAKPAGLPTLPGGGFLQATLLQCVRDYAPDAAPVHRLGRWTSGLVLCARNALARAALVRHWPETGKRYRALAAGIPAWAETAVATPIGPVPHALLGTIHAATAAGKPARSHVTVLERRPDGFLCDVRIETGRPHQVRIHLAAAGHPLVGDPIYVAGGVPAPGTHALPGDPGYLLHSAALHLRHPRSGRGLLIECPPPAPLCLAGERPLVPPAVAPDDTR